MGNNGCVWVPLATLGTTRTCSTLDTPWGAIIFRFFSISIRRRFGLAALCYILIGKPPNYSFSLILVLTVRIMSHNPYLSSHHGNRNSYQYRGDETS